MFIFEKIIEAIKKIFYRPKAIEAPKEEVLSKRNQIWKNDYNGDVVVRMLWI